MKYLPNYSFLLVLIFSQNLMSWGNSPKELLPYEDEIFLNETINVSSTVTGQDGESLIGVNVQVKGTNKGTATDFDGKFTLEDVDGNAVLVFSYVGYETQEVAISNQSIINIVLQIASTRLSEVVVTALGIEREAKSLTYSTQHVATEALTEARSLNVVNSLQGKVAGLSIETAGTGLGGGSRVLLRGNRSLSGGSGPLYVVDGVPMSTSIGSFSPDNIESINILKGPNAAALYGSSASNGAIIIETKKGTDGVIQVSLNETFIVGSPIHYFEPQNLYGQGFGGVYSATAEESWGPKMTGQMVDHWSGDPEKSGTQYPLLPQPDNFKDMFQTSTYMTHNLNATVGSKYTQTAFSYTREDARGLMENNKLGRHNASVRVTSQFKDWLSLDTKLNYIHEELDNQHGTGDNAANNPYMNIYRMPRNIVWNDVRKYEYTDLNGLNKQNFWDPGSTTGRNPYWIMNNTLNYRTTDRIMGLAALTINFTDKLKFLARTSYDGGSNGYYRTAYVDSYGSSDNFGNFNASSGNPSGTWNSDGILSYTGNIVPDLSIMALVGGNIRKSDGAGSTSANIVQGLIIPNFFSFGNAPDNAGSYSYATQSELQALYFSANFGWKSLVYLDVTGRNDWSSTLPASSRSYFYPSVGLSTVLTDLISTLPDYLSYAKLRGSWAKVGSGTSPYSLSRSLIFSGTGGRAGFIVLGSTLPNTDLKPETTESYEIGLDMHFFNGRIGLDITAYKTNTFDQLFTITLPSGSGAAAFFTNGGDVENKGMEMVLSAIPVENKDFTWDISSNFATNRNWVNAISDDRPSIRIGGDSYLYDFIVEEDSEYGNIYTRGWKRDEQGRVLVAANGMPLITSGRTVKAANFNPDWMGAISNSLSYKNLSFSFLIEHRQGGSVVSATDALLYGEGIALETVAGREGGLIFGDNLFGNETAVTEDGSPNTTAVDAETFWKNVGGRNAPIGEAFVVEATNTRLREATIGFTLPKSIFNSTSFISNVKLSLVGRNLFFLHRVGNWDPEIFTGTNTAAAGYNAYLPPTERTFGLNLKIKF